MAFLIVQLSDLHARVDDNPICERWDALCRAVLSDMGGVTTCVLVFCGDAAWSGKSEEFVQAGNLLNKLASCIHIKAPEISLRIISIPGNHDCDLTSEDQNARITLRKGVFASRPSKSIERILLEPQRNYFQFSKELAGGEDGALTLTSPFYNHIEVTSNGRIIRFHLLNSAWTSILHEMQDLRYPLEELNAPTVPTADFAIAVMHHPYYWFLAPEVRRELRDQIEMNSDLILTGHEHENELSERSVDQGPNLSYLEGGVLQEKERPALCSFNIIRLDFESNSRLIKRYIWATDYFAVEGSPQIEILMLNSLRRDRKLRLTSEFEKQLDELEDLVNHPRASDVRLSQIFSYPDLRRHGGQGLETSDEEKKDSVQIAARIRSDRVFDEIMKQEYCLILGGDKAGKTSLARRLFSEIHRIGKAPLFLKGKDLSNSGSEEGLKRTITKAIKEQYRNVTFEQYTQLPQGCRTLVFDDLQESPTDRAVRSRILKYFSEFFDRIILVSSNEFYLEALSEHGSNPLEFVPYKLYDICDFGQARLHDLAGRWVKLRNPDVTSEQLHSSVRDLCEKVELVLRTAGLPHTPWLLVVMIENAEAPESTSAKSGAYGKLYEAIITVTLSKSEIKIPDIDGKYLYLARFAHHLYTLCKASISEAEAMAFHSAHCAEYDWTISYEKLRDDFLRYKIFRQDGDNISFRYKYLYCYFVANWLQRNIHTDAARVEIHKLSQQLYHDVSASVLVMLASLTQDPVVLSEMRLGAGSLYSKYKPATMVEEVLGLNELEVSDNSLALPLTTPEENRKQFREVQDEVRVKGGNEDHDGRLVEPSPETQETIDGSSATKIVTKEIKDIRAALRTMDILGQVLRNGATSQTAEEKLAIMEEIVMLGRRVLGHYYGFLSDIDDIINFTRDVFSGILKADQTVKDSGNVDSSQVAESIEPTEVLLATDAEQESSSGEPARLLANRFWFDLFTMGSQAVVKRMGTTLSMRALDPTMQRLLSKDPVLVNKLVEIEMLLNRRDSHIPADEIVALHKKLKLERNKVARIVLESLVFERLIMFETNYRDVQKVCSELNIKSVPPQIYDMNSKKFTPKI